MTRRAWLQMCAVAPVLAALRPLRQDDGPYLQRLFNLSADSGELLELHHRRFVVRTPVTARGFYHVSHCEFYVCDDGWMSFPFNIAHHGSSVTYCLFSCERNLARAMAQVPPGSAILLAGGTYEGYSTGSWRVRDESCSS